MVVSSDQSLRKENVSAVVDGFALRLYKFKSFLMINPSSANKETYWQETAADLTGTTTTVGGIAAGVEGVARGAEFPHLRETWQEKFSIHKKHGGTAVLYWEDIRTNDIDVMRRTLLRVARAVVKSVDAECWDVITESQSANLINSVTSTAAWDAGSGQDPIKDINRAIRLIEENDYEVVGSGNGVLAVNPKDFESLITWLISTKGASVPEFASSRIQARTMGKILGLTVTMSNNVTADFAAVFVAKDVGVWKTGAPLTTVTKEDPGISSQITSWEFGSAQLTNPKAMSLIGNTAT